MLEDLQKSLQETQNFLTQTVEKVSKSTQDPIEAGKNSLNQGFKTLTETGNSAINKITGVAEQAKDALTKVTDQSINQVNVATSQAIDKSINQVNVATSQAIDKLTETADKAQASLNETLQSAEKLSNTAVEALQKAIAASLTNWLEAHPILAWLIAHPLFTLVLLLLLWLLLGGLFRAIARLTEQVWLSVFHSPLKLGQWLMGIVPQPFIRAFNLRTANPSSNPNDKEKRLSSILSRLEEIKQEQNELWQEMTAILALKT